MLPTKFQVKQEKKRKINFQDDSAMAAILGFRSERLPSFKSTGLFVQEKKRKIDFQDGRHSGHLGFLRSERFQLFFYFQLTQMFPTEYKVNWPFFSGEKAKK